MPERELPSVDSLIIGVSIDRDARREKITRRLKQRLQEGMVDEIKGLLDRGIPAENLIYYGLEYKFITEYVIGKTTYDEMFRGLEIAIHQLPSADDLVPRYGAKRVYHQLDRCPAADGTESGAGAGDS